MGDDWAIISAKARGTVGIWPLALPCHAIAPALIRGVDDFLCSGWATFAHPASPQQNRIDTKGGGICGQLGSWRSRQCGGHGPRRPMFLWTTAGIVSGQCSAPEAAAYAALSASSRKIVSQEPAVARPASSPPHGLEGHGASRRRDEFPSLPWLYRVRPRCRFGREVSRSKGAPLNP